MHKIQCILILFLLSLMLGCVAHAQWVQTNGPYNGGINCFAVSGTNLFAGTINGGVFLSTDNGTSWTAVNNGLTDATVRAFAEAPVLVFEHANLIDGISDAPQRDVTVVVADGKINVVSAARISSPANAKRFDLSGRWLLPGFIDAHTHPFNIKFAQSMLSIGGMTTGRSMFTGRYVDVELRERHRRGEFDIPDILAAGYPVVPNIGTFPIPIRMAAIFEDHPQLEDLRGVADIGVAGAQRIVRANLDRHVDLIKVFATNRAFFLSMDPRGRALSIEQLVAAVAEAHNAGIPVAAHALGDEGVAAAVGAGVNSIEHGIYLTDATLELMKEKNAYFVPTISVYPPQGQTKRSNASDADAMAARRQDMAVSVRDSARRAHKMGLRVIAGTDGGGSIGGEIIELVGIGMTPMEAIQAATSRCAEALGISKRTGSIRPGMEADLIVLDANPLEDIKAVRDVVLVVNDGRVVAKIFYNGAEASSIHVAAGIGDLTRVRGFLEKGVDVNMKGARRETALHIASRNGHKEIVELLLAHGADVNAGAWYNRTAADMAMWANHTAIVELLIAKGADDISPLHLAVHKGDLAKAKDLIEQGADANKQTRRGATPLHRAAAAGLKDIAALLIEKGADVNAEMNWPWTPLHSAAENGHKDIVELLIAKGADVNAKDGGGMTSLYYAKAQGHAEIVELLRKHGAKE